MSFRPGKSSSSSPRSAREHSRRPISPGSLRELDLPSDPLSRSQSLPIPPTGHELMALFPAPSPPIEPSGNERRATSEYFKNQERAYFGMPGREIIRLSDETDGGHHSGSGNNRPKPRPRSSSSTRSLHNPTSPALSHHHHSPSIHSASPVASPQYRYPPQSQSDLRLAIPHYPQSSPVGLSPQHIHAVYGQHPPANMRSPVYDPKSASSESAIPVDEDPEEAWRPPIPQSERRRAGKHTRRVIVKS